MTYSSAVIDKLRDLSDEERTALAKDALASARQMAEEIIEVRGNELDLGEMGKYTLRLEPSTLSCNRDGELFKKDNTLNEFVEVFHVNNENVTGLYYRIEALNAAETMQALHTAVFPSQN